MKQMIAVKIDTSKIDKEKLFVGRNGTKYLDVMLIETPDGKYGDFMVVQSVSKEEREAGVRGAILGNGKNLGVGGPKPPAPRPVSAQDSKPEDESIPF